MLGVYWCMYLVARLAWQRANEPNEPARLKMCVTVLSHGITAAFGSVYISLHTERNKAVKSWDNGRVWFGIYHYIPRETRPLSHGITAAFGSVYITIYQAKQGR